MKFQDLNNKTAKELNQLLGEDREKLRDLRFKLASRQLKNLKMVGKVKKEIAQILTVLSKN